MFAPENTLPAFSAALEVGFGIELDVHRTADGEVAVIHDDTVNRTTDGRGKVSELTWEEMRRLDAGAWFHPAFAGVRVPSLREVLRAAIERSLLPTPIAVQLKCQEDDFVTKVARIVEEEGLTRRAFLFGFRTGEAVRAKRLAGDVPVVVAAHDVGEFEAALGEPDANGIWVYFVPRPEQVEAAQSAGKEVYVSPLVPQNEEVYRQLLEAGVTGVCTDFPFRCRKVWRKNKNAK